MRNKPKTKGIMNVIASIEARHNWCGRAFGSILALLALLLGAGNVGAQNVTISPKTGNLIGG